MGVRGWVYVITNEAMPGLVKVGYSTKDPLLRAAELNNTGIPHPYRIEYDVLVHEPRNIEQRVHKALLENREGKEWFRCSVVQAVNAIRHVVGSSALMENVGAALDSGCDKGQRTSRTDPECSFEGCSLNADNELMGQHYCSRHYREVWHLYRAANRTKSIARIREELAAEWARRKREA